MTRVLIDTNVVLDVLFDRAPHAASSGAVWEAVENRRAAGMLSAHAITTVHYLSRKQLGDSGALEIVRSLLGVFEVATVNGEVLSEALALGFADFENAVTAAAAHRAGCALLVTRNTRGFSQSPIPAFTPAAALPILS